jgi:hypothetical protein
MAALCFFIWTACQKEPSITKVAEVTQDDVTPKIKLFSERLRLASMPNAEVSARGAAYSSEDAVWNLEALINHLYGHPSEYCEGEFKSENKTIVVPKINGQISDRALLAAYTTMWTNQRNFYNSVTDANKHIAAVDVELAEDNTTSAKLSVTTYIGNSNNTVLTPTSGDWVYGGNLGKCDKTISTGDAAKEINKAVNSGLGTVGSFFTLTNIKVVDLDNPANGIAAPTSSNPNFKFSLINTNDATVKDNKRDYLIFYIRSNYPNFVSAQCISESDISWYVNNINSVIIPAAQPTGLTAISINLAGAVLSISDPYPILHRGQFIFGKKVKKIKTPIEAWIDPNDFQIIGCC